MSNNNNEDSDSDASVWEDLCDFFGAGGQEKNVREWNFIGQRKLNKFLEQSQLDQSNFSLEYNSTDRWLLEQAQVEIKHILHLFESSFMRLTMINTSPQQSYFLQHYHVSYWILSVLGWKQGCLAGGNRSHSPPFTFGNICLSVLWVQNENVGDIELFTTIWSIKRWGSTIQSCLGCNDQGRQTSIIS